MSIVCQVFNILSDYVPHRFDEFSIRILGSDHRGAFNLHARVTEIRTGKMDGLPRTIISWMDGKLCVYALLTPAEDRVFRGDRKSHSQATREFYWQAKDEVSRMVKAESVEQLSLIK